METRNFYIIIASIAVGMVISWLFIYVIVELDVDFSQDPNMVIIQGSGVNREINLTITDLKSDKYEQVIDKSFHIVKGPPSPKEYDIIYSGVSIWSILIAESLLELDASSLTFEFWARDLYHSPKPLNLTIAKNNPGLVIIAYEENGVPLFEEGPLRSVIDQTVIPEGEYSSQYSVQMLNKIIINT